MSRSPLDLLKKHEFKEKMDKYIVEVEKYIDGQMDISYDEFLDDGFIIIQCASISELLFQHTKKLPMLIRVALKAELPKIYSEWDVELNERQGFDSRFIFRVGKTEKQGNGSVSEIESRSELLDFEPEDPWADDENIEEDPEGKW